MLDLNSLALRRAQSVNEKEDDWKKAIWSQDFQRISVNMSDGEVESLVDMCPSFKHFECVVKMLEERSKTAGVSPFSALTQEAQKAGVTPAAWVKSCLGKT